MNYFPENEIAKTHPSVNENSHPIDAADRKKLRPGCARRAWSSYWRAEWNRRGL